MEQHPIPQQISSYEFKLVGDMTLKQFLKAGAGIVIAVLINSSGLIFFLKYPLMLIFGGGGLMLAFVPFEDRPLETWIIAFLRSIYSPTIYTYKKSPNKEWLELLGTKSGPGTSKSDQTFEGDEGLDTIAPAKDRDRIREFIESLPTVMMGNNSGAKAAPKPAAGTQEIVEEKQEIGKIGVPTGFNKLPASEPEAAEPAREGEWRDQKTGLDLKKEKLAATAVTTFGEIPMPNKPDIPNMIVGMVTDNSGKIVEDAIVEIQDQNGNPSRVLKTNPLGQFRTTSPLGNGKYLIITEKEPLKFDRVEVVLNNQIVEPVKIKAIL